VVPSTGCRTSCDGRSAGCRCAPVACERTGHRSARRSITRVCARPVHGLHATYTSHPHCRERVYDMTPASSWGVSTTCRRRQFRSAADVMERGKRALRHARRQ
jgi:hypothetical protein